MTRSIGYLRRIHRIAHDETLSAAERLGRIQAQSFVAVTEADAVELDNAAWSGADRRSYGHVATLEYVRAYKCAYTGVDFTPVTTPELDGFADGRAHRARHGGALAESLMDATMATGEPAAHATDAA